MIVLYGANWCPDCRRSKAFLSEQRIPYEYIDLEKVPEASKVVESYNNGKHIIPTIVFDDGSILTEPSNEDLADKLGLSRTATRDTYDLVIIGGGPTGLTTGIYAARENLKTVIIDRSALGGQAGVTERFDNYPGFPDGIGGSELANRFVQQAERYGVEMLPAVSVTRVSEEQGSVMVTTSTGQNLLAGAALIATGSTYRRTGARGESELIGSGVHFCATCDGPFYRDAEEVVVLGGGNSGLEEGLFLAQFAKHVTVIERGTKLAASKILQDKVAAHPRMTLVTETQIVGFNENGEGKLTSVSLIAPDGSEYEHSANGVFVFIGLLPNTQWLEGAVDVDKAGFIVTDRMMNTSVPGVFAAGDVRAGSTKQVASAVGEGAAVAIQIRHHLDTIKGI